MTPKQIDSALDRLAVKIVSVVAARIERDKLAAYDGIEAAREVKAMMAGQFWRAYKPSNRPT